jgi:hypothetical protein
VNADPRQGWAEALPWYDGTFDLVLCINAFHQFAAIGDPAAWIDAEPRAVADAPPLRDCRDIGRSTHDGGTHALPNPRSRVYRNPVPCGGL